ncbi:two-component system response regulator [Frankia sp. CcI49]|nr:MULTISPECIES: response regulator transcription factor [unclassified Frankia]KPM53094.1 two component transcriptional regulator [Frankia sp. R43]ONH58635.1 two-component system response regulator [Frankia sp. CcI49]
MGAGAPILAEPDPGRRPLLLIADNEADDELLPALRDQGIEVAVVADGALALVEIGRLAPSAVLLTANLPVVDGVTVVRTVRSAQARTTTPILFAVGPDEREQAAAALEAGATVCLGKPFRIHEVLAMVGAVGGPAGLGAATTMAAGTGGGAGTGAGAAVPAQTGPVTGPVPSAVERSEVLRSGPVVLDVDAHEVTVDGRTVHMPPREFRLLRLLLGHAGRVVTREMLLTEVWGSPDTDPNTLAVHVRRLRRRLGDQSAPEPPAGPSAGRSTGRVLGETRPPLIESIRGIGYRFRAHPS